MVTHQLDELMQQLNRFQVQFLHLLFGDLCSHDLLVRVRNTVFQMSYLSPLFILFCSGYLMFLMPKQDIDSPNLVILIQRTDNYNVSTTYFLCWKIFNFRSSPLSISTFYISIILIQCLPTVFYKI